MESESGCRRTSPWTAWLLSSRRLAVWRLQQVARDRRGNAVLTGLDGRGERENVDRG